MIPKSQRGDVFHRSLVAALVGILVVSALGLWVSADSKRQLESDHFLLTYVVSGGVEATATAYAASVRDALEAAYQVLVVQDRFPVPTEKIEVQLVETQSGEFGSEYLIQDEDGALRPVIEIAVEAAMQDALSGSVVTVTLEDEVRSTAAHELFHAIQDTLALRSGNDMSDLLFVESLATWAQEEVVPLANDYLEPALDFLVAPDALGFFYRTYDAGIFWVFLASRHGGAQAIRRVMTSSVAFDGRYTIENAFAAEGLSFLDLWEEFAVALAAESVPDADRIKTLFPLPDPQAKSQRPTRFVELPPPVYQGTWNGGEVTIDRVTAASETLYDSEFDEDPIGTALRVAHAYGIDFLHLVTNVDRPMTIAFSGDPGTEFRVDVVTRRGSSVTSQRLSQDAPVRIDLPSSYDEIRVVVTRGEAGTGTYHLTLREG